MPRHRLPVAMKATVFDPTTKLRDTRFRGIVRDRRSLRDRVRRHGANTWEAPKSCLDQRAFACPMKTLHLQHRGGASTRAGPASWHVEMVVMFDVHVSPGRTQRARSSPSVTPVSSSTLGPTSVVSTDRTVGNAYSDVCLFDEPSHLSQRSIRTDATSSTSTFATAFRAPCRPEAPKETRRSPKPRKRSSGY